MKNKIIKVLKGLVLLPFMLLSIAAAITFILAMIIFAFSGVKDLEEKMNKLNNAIDAATEELYKDE